MPGKLDALHERVGDLEVRLHETTAAVDENTRITKQIEAHTGLLAEHTSALVDMVRTYGEVKTTASVVKRSVTWTGGLAAAMTAIGGAAVAAWHWFRGG